MAKHHEEAKVLKDGGRVIINLKNKDDSTPGKIITRLIYLVPGLFLVIFFSRPWAMGGYSLPVFRKTYLTHARGMLFLVFLISGLGLILFSIISLLRISRKLSRPKHPGAYIFDNWQHRFLISERPWNPKNPLELTNLPGYNYSQLSGFFVRSFSAISYTTTSFNSEAVEGTVKNFYNKYFAVSVRKKDGGFWDLFEGSTEETALLSVKELEQAVPLKDDKNAQKPAVNPLSGRIRRFSSGGSVWYCWNNRVNFSGSALGLLIVALCGAGGFFIAQNLFIVGGISLVFLLILLNALWNAWVNDP